MPQKPVHDSTSYRTQQLATHISSNRALLALAHANALKENVGQAVSAISMGKAQLNGTVKFPVQTPADISDSTKHNLRQAIMVKNTSPGIPGGETGRDKPDGAGKAASTERGNKSICLTFLPNAIRNGESSCIVFLAWFRIAFYAIGSHEDDQILRAITIGSLTEISRVSEISPFSIGGRLLFGLGVDLPALL